MKSLVTVSLAMLLVLSAGSAFGSVVGVNPILDAQGGQLFIPIQDSTSGILGDSLAGGNTVGGQQDILTLVGDGVISEGTVSFLLTFSVAGQIPEGHVVDTSSAILVLTPNDLDFKPVNTASNTYRESLELTFLQNAIDPVGGTPDLIIDNGAAGVVYTTFRNDGGTATDNVTVQYLIDMVADMGLTQDDVDNIDEDNEFALWVTLRTHRAQTAGGSHTYGNTSEDLANTFEFSTFIPEPASMSMLGLGALALLRRRR